MTPFTIRAGRPWPMGLTCRDGGVNVAVFSAHASRIELCLFDDQGREHQRLPLPEREGDIWFGFVPDLRPGMTYGLRAHGPYRPDQGDRFNPHKLLIDPYARALTGLPQWGDALLGWKRRAAARDLTLDPADSAALMPRAIVTEDPGPLPGPRPEIPIDRSVIYEAHVKGLTRLHPQVPHPGSFLALGSEPMIAHFRRLGITAVELLPVQAFLTDGFLHEKGLVNYWGYQTLNFFAPDPRYVVQDGIAEFRAMAQALHAAGIELILDVVYNHTCEGNELGPTLSFRGLDNRSYYRLAPDQRHHVNDTGTGNTLRLDHPMVLRMVMDSLRWWVVQMGVDGFRFDLAATLGRSDAHGGGFDRQAPLFQAIAQDPVLSRVKLIAEPWDIGPGGYQLGAFPPPFCEWNDRFRDGVRRFWRGDPGRAPDLAERLTGSARQFDHSGRGPWASVNFITAHDGFTLADLNAYADKHNLANGEDNRDGHSENYSDNFGTEGPSDDPALHRARAARARAMLATLLLAQGTPMLLAGDELGHSQQGNNNAYAQDNAITWLDWARADQRMTAWVARLIALRARHPILRQRLFLHGRPRPIDGQADLVWRRADGRPMDHDAWMEAERDHLCMELRTAPGTPAWAASESAVFVVFHAGEGPLPVRLPPGTGAAGWVRVLDSAAPEAAPAPCPGPFVPVAGQSVTVFVMEPGP